MVTIKRLLMSLPRLVNRFLPTSLNGPDDKDARTRDRFLQTPCAFNTWNRGNPQLNQPMRKWGAGLEKSWWGYLRIIDFEGKEVVNGTRQITSHRSLGEVKQCMRDVSKRTVSGG
jgi:hypothetical protein